MMQTLHESESLTMSSNYEGMFGVLQYNSDSKPRMTPNQMPPSQMTPPSHPSVTTPTTAPPSGRKHSRNQSSDVHTLVPPKRMASETEESQFTCIFSASGTIIFASPSIQSFLGIYPSEMIGVPMSDYLHHEDVDQFMAIMNSVMTNGIPRQLVYRLNIESNNSHACFEGLARPYVPDDSDQCQGITLMSKPAHQQAAQVPLHHEHYHQQTHSSASSPTILTGTSNTSAMSTTHNTHNNSRGESPSSSAMSISNTIGSLNHSNPSMSSLVQLSSSSQTSDHGNLWLRRQVARMHKSRSENDRSASLSVYDLEPQQLSVLTTHSAAPPTPLETYDPFPTGVSMSPSSTYDLHRLATPSMPSANSSLPSATYSSASPFDDDTTASSFMTSLTSADHLHHHMPASATAPSFAYDDSWSANSLTGHPLGGYAAMRSYSYFDVGYEPSMAVCEEAQIKKMDDEGYYWDNTTNSELISPHYNVGRQNYSIKQPLSSYYMSTQQVRGKSYSLPGAFDAMGRPYQQYQHNTTKLANPGHIDFSGYSMSVKAKASKSTGEMNPPPTPGQQLSAKSRKKSKHNISHEAERHVCAECGVVESPEWRKGPQGRKTLCNACGLRWAKRTRKEDTKKKR